MAKVELGMGRRKDGKVGRSIGREYGCIAGHLDGLRHCRWQIFWAVATGIICGFSSGFGVPLLLRYVVGNVFSDGERSILHLLYYCSLPILLMGIRTFSGFLNTYSLAIIGQAILQSIRLKIFQKIQRLPIAFFRRTQTGELVSRAFNDANMIQSCFVSIAHEIIQRPMMLIGAVVATIYLCLQQTNGWMLLLVLVLVGASGLPIAHFGRQVWWRNLRAQERIADLTANMTENLQAVQEVRAFCLEHHEMLRFRRISRSYSRAYLDTCRSYYFIVPSIELWAAIGISLALFYAYTLHISGETFLAIATALFLTYDPVKNIGRLYGNLQNTFSSLSRIEVLLQEPETAPVLGPPDLLLPKGVHGEIAFRDLSFSYDPDRPVLKHIDLTLEARKSYALVGPSGAGKTTLANLILRFYEAQEGTLTVDGHDIRRFPPHQLRTFISLVPQQPILLHDTVYANIRLGKLAATRREVQEAAQRAHAADFIAQLPKGMDTVIGEDGSYLSGGQRQRIALARAFLRDAPILILDEATSALDTQSEKEIRDVLPRLFQGRTVLLISHHFHWLPHVDEVIVLDGGAIVQRGGHDQLIGQEGLYRRLHAMYTSS
jgi:subfamily B ATP-binding cassette protein MsbA